jgi:D-alanyl-lipoteichoic acid acyltransferase DltB (MBOAT superfamily)
VLFNSFIFLFFLAVVLPGYYFLSRKYKTPWLLVASYVFYGYWDWRFCSLLFTSTIADFFIGQVLHRSSTQQTRKRWLLLSMVINLGILAFFKYFNFFTDSFQTFVSPFGMQLDYLHLNIILPVGISFYTFQTMSYAIDIYRKKLEPTKSFLDFALFVSFFPQLVAGPIERATNLLPQIARLKNPNANQVQHGIALIVLGLFKKVMIGDACGRIVDRVFSQMEYYNSVELLMALVMFSVQIYADFSGYSSIARGVGKLLGVELMRNFEQPYLSTNITEFWRRWHISLSSWLRDYLYISLGGNRKGVQRTYVNLMITMLLGGLWHGASWNFVIWGGLHGLYLAVHKWMLGERRVVMRPQIRNTAQGLTYLGKGIATYLLVLLTWLFFRSQSFADATLFLERVLAWEGSDLAWRFVKIGGAYLAMTLLLDLAEYKTQLHAFVLKIKSVPIRYGILVPLFVIVLVFMFQSEPLPFIYFQF